MQAKIGQICFICACTPNSCVPSFTHDVKRTQQTEIFLCHTITFLTHSIPYEIITLRWVNPKMCNINPCKGVGSKLFEFLSFFFSKKLYVIVRLAMSNGVLRNFIIHSWTLDFRLYSVYVCSYLNFTANLIPSSCSGRTSRW